MDPSQELRRILGFRVGRTEQFLNDSTLERQVPFSRSRPRTGVPRYDEARASNSSVQVLILLAARQDGFECSIDLGDHMFLGFEVRGIVNLDHGTHLPHVPFLRMSGVFSFPFFEQFSIAIW